MYVGSTGNSAWRADWRFYPMADWRSYPGGQLEILLRWLTEDPTQMINWRSYLIGRLKILFEWPIGGMIIIVEGVLLHQPHQL